MNLYRLNKFGILNISNGNWERVGFETAVCSPSSFTKALFLSWNIAIL